MTTEDAEVHRGDGSLFLIPLGFNFEASAKLTYAQLQGARARLYCAESRRGLAARE
jgi:hypothetical protein